MYDKDSKGISYSAGFFMLIAFTIAGFFLYAVISAPLWNILTGQPSQEIQKGLVDPANSDAGKVMQSLYAIIGFFLPAVFTASLLNKKPFNLLGFSKTINPRQIGLVVLIVTSALFVGGALTYLNYQIPVSAGWKIRFDKMEADYNQQVQAIIRLRNISDYIVAMIVMGFLPAFCEETLFRGGLQNFLFRSTKSPWLAIIVVSIIFSAVHFSFYGFLFRFLLSFVLGWIYHYSGKIWLNIFAHFLNNATVITIYYMSIRQGRPLNDVPDETALSYWGFLALPVLIGFLLLFKRIFFNTKTQ
jgi:membrane protease YdiL (CAAX protease family)